MTRTLEVVSGFLIALAIGVPAASHSQQQPETARTPDKGEFVNMRGCVHGSLLTSIRLDPATVSRDALAVRPTEV